MGDEKTYELMVPYDDSWLGLRMNLMSTPVIGEVNYIPYEAGDSIYSFNILSNATAFWDIVGSNILSINLANLNIIESTDLILSGTFSFLENDTTLYSGEFQMELRN